MRILVTGTAGFIGCEVALRLLARGDEVVGIDNLNDYYDPALKVARLARFESFPHFKQEQFGIEDTARLLGVFERFRPQRVVHLAAQAGVRYSLENPNAYIASNLVGFANILEGCRHHDVEHLVYASSSSVYGANTSMPFSVHHNVDHPVSLYAATKKSNELMAHTYSNLYALPTTGLRFFTVYGPWGRPDMAYYKFVKAILNSQPIEVYNHGQCKRDFTYIDDIVEGVLRTLDKVAAPDASWDSAAPDPGTSAAPYRIYNIGNNQPVQLLHFIEVIEDCLGKKADKKMLPLQPGDVPATYANIDDLTRDVGFRPKTPVEEGISLFVDWYRRFYGQ